MAEVDQHPERSTWNNSASMGRCIAICNQKGGVGKSTTAVNVGSFLALSGKRTLLIDLDPQGNATTCCGIQRNSLKKNTLNLLVDGASPIEVIQQTAVQGLELVPSNLEVAAAEERLGAIEENETVLRRACEPLRNMYDFVLFDCPPSLGLLTINALVAADSTIIPVQCEYLALEGLNALMQSVRRIKERLNPGLRVGGIVLTMADFRATLTREVADEVRRFFGGLVFDTAIPRNVRLAESPSFGKPICLYDPLSTGAAAYRALTHEVLKTEGREGP